LQATYLPDKRSEIYLRFKTECKPINESATSFVINYPVDKVKQNIRLHYSTEITNHITIKARTELVWFDKKGTGAEEGFLSFAEMGYQYSVKLKGNVRLQYFETGGYNSRIYTYENDVLYSFSIPAFYDKGFRYYINASYDVTKKLTVWVRIAQTIYKDKQMIGSGLDEINGSGRTEIKLQAKYNF
jgi:hypothetical protein